MMTMEIYNLDYYRNYRKSKRKDSQFMVYFVRRFESKFKLIQSMFRMNCYLYYLYRLKIEYILLFSIIIVKKIIQCTLFQLKKRRTSFNEMNYIVSNEFTFVSYVGLHQRSNVNDLIVENHDWKIRNRSNNRIISSKLNSILSYNSIRFIFGTLFIMYGCTLEPIEAVTVTEVHVVSIPSGRTDYVVAGESVQLSCHYILRPDERVIAVNWAKDGSEVYFSTPNRRPIALSLFRGHVDYNSADLLNTVTLFGITMSFAGQYACRVITEKSESENTAHMTVVVDACKDANWRTKTDMVNCVEEISFHCVGMFPKPSPACSIHNDATDQYFAGETFDLIERLPNGTYEIAMQRRYSAENFTEFAGQLSFHCDLLVLMTSWRLGIRYKLFGDAGCVNVPPEIANGSRVVSGERTCWNTPRESSRAIYSCDEPFQLLGPSVLVCRNGNWIPDTVHLMTQPVTDLQSLRLPNPYCAMRRLSASSSVSAINRVQQSSSMFLSTTIHMIIFCAFTIIHHLLPIVF
ncbi:hypothetical protein BLOT_004307 [Blomia tropicalis]|nr:hypothetical protein BLOT_004307 [Blomia tropicalis]